MALGACKVCLDSLAIRWEEREMKGDSCFSLFPYQGFGRDLIHRMKFQSGYEIAVTLGLFLGLAAREEPKLAKVDVLVPVPLSEHRLEKRGFNQAMILADTMKEVWKRPVCNHVVRTRETETQSGLSLTKRKHNVRGAFAVLPGFDFRNKHCLIVDDVITSGSTFYSLSRLIEDYGGRPMGVFAARTEILRGVTKMLRNCEECNRLFSHPARSLCQDCYDQAKKSFDAVKKYLRDNPGATVAQVARDTEVDLELIYDYIREGRLDVIPKDARLQCSICGAPISVGRVCAKCRNDLRSTMTSEPTRSQGKPKVDSRVHTLENIKDR